MRQETNNEMDLLLRRLGRRDEEPASNGDGHLNHLDADELSAYAENALPAAARARYTEHLAECTRCRELVVSLSGAAGVAVARETVTIAEPSGFRKFLAGFFSPMVLRYAAPALGLILIAVIGLVVLRRPETGNIDFVAQAPREEPVPSPAASQSPTPASGFLTYSVDKEGVSAKPDAQKKSGEQPAPVPNAPPSVSSINAEVRQDAGAAAQPVPKESAAAPKTADATDEIKSKAEAEARKEESAARVTVANEPPPPKEKTSEHDERERRQVAEAAPASVQKRALRGLAAGTGAIQRDGGDKDNYNYAETRSVGGRRFRKEGSIWIDTAYDASRSTTTLARGSEQFRALVADEPGLKSIADQLEGEFIVVWKGRTYRIR